MLEIFLSFIWLLIGIIAIGKGSDWFTDALIPMARRLGTSRVSIGLILVSVSVFCGGTWS